MRAAGIASARGGLALRPVAGRNEAWHIESRCSAFARSLLEMDIDIACHPKEAVTEAAAEPVARAATATRTPRTRKVSRVRWSNRTSEQRRPRPARPGGESGWLAAEYCRVQSTAFFTRVTTTQAVNGFLAP